MAKKEHHQHRAECEEKIEVPAQPEMPSASEDPMAALTAERDELKASYLRLAADMDNYRKRIQKEKEDYQKYAIKGLVETLLPVLDNFGRCLKAEGDAESLKKGAEMILSQLEDALMGVGLRKIEVAAGDEFDPQWAEALMMEENKEAPHSLTVAEVFEDGWCIGDSVLRTAKVKVYKK